MNSLAVTTAHQCFCLHHSNWTDMGWKLMKLNMEYVLEKDFLQRIM